LLLDTGGGFSTIGFFDRGELGELFLFLELLIGVSALALLKDEDEEDELCAGEEIEAEVGLRLRLFLFLEVVTTVLGDFLVELFRVSDSYSSSEFMALAEGELDLELPVEELLDKIGLKTCFSSREECR
jgi:hypothetical protein